MVASRILGRMVIHEAVLLKKPPHQPTRLQLEQHTSGLGGGERGEERALQARTGVPFFDSQCRSPPFPCLELPESLQLGPGLLLLPPGQCPRKLVLHLEEPFLWLLGQLASAATFLLESQLV